MALKKSIRQPDGVVTSYHRILQVISTINKQNSISVLSYVDDVARMEEKTSDENLHESIGTDDYMKSSESSVSPYVQAVTYETDYNENMSTEDAYRFLKSLPEFGGAQDI